MKMRFILAALTASIVITGCKVGPDYKEPNTSMPAKFSSVEPNTTTSAPASVVHWWQKFNDPNLNRLVDEASVSNLDLKIAWARIQQARAILGITAADEWPTVDVSANYSRNRRSENSIPGIGSIGALEYSNFQTGFDTAWELDIFGRTRRAIEADKAEIQVAQAQQRDVLVSLTAEVARNYVLVRELQLRIAINRDNARTQRDSLEIAEARFKAGLTSELNVAQARAQLATTQSQLPSLEQQLAETIHRLSVLIAREPGALSQRFNTFAAIPITEANIPVGLPSELLRRRPDIRSAERSLAAATARIGAAKADLFPRFSLTGSLGLQSTQGKQLFNSSSKYWSIGPGVQWPILDWGRIRSNIALQNANVLEAAAQYENTILRALEETENAIVAFNKEKTRREYLHAAVNANQRALDLSTELYQKGLVDFLNVIEAQRALYLVQDQFAQSQGNVATNMVAVYKALGGGWEE